MKILCLILVAVGGLICFLSKKILKVLKVQADGADFDKYVVYVKAVGFFVAAFGALILFIKG
ncbi:hypothetical protein [Acetivibrio sp. MSJd-27]|uniref:hypothetical protein n=1 Tax=Acetivibrio sp. MSJd-27 TaxID=2841523 RepID=UPI001C0FD178|nr:hypothetical protein [Acetivibrio sp. MSJd-27]MBU5450304.1 hypothetical protein [Acetivibrio sp. MSJd-27]